MGLSLTQARSSCRLQPNPYQASHLVILEFCLTIRLLHIYTYLCMSIHMTKLMRHKLILELLEGEKPANQEELRLALVKRGCRVTQATLSRDIRELGLAKTADGYSAVQAEASEPQLPTLYRMVREFVTKIHAAQNMLVVKTTVGSAQPVAAALDAESWPEMMGSIAGDDTIFIVSRDRKSARQLVGRIGEMLA